MRIFQVDAFTRTRFAGNPATVVLDADAASDDTLSAIAREFAHAETAFVLAAAAPDHDVRLRFFNSRKETPFVGHASIAAHAVLHAVGGRPAGRWRQLSGTGILDICLDKRSGEVEFRQTAPLLEAPLPYSTSRRVAAALRLPAAQLHGAMGACVARKGSARLLMPVAHASALQSLAPDQDALLELGRELAVEGFFVFALDAAARGLSTDARMFCPAIGIPEDPVSGNAHAMLAFYLWQQRELSATASAFTGRQGRYVNRPGEVSVKLEFRGHEPIAARIGGAAVIVSEGVLSS